MKDDYKSEAERSAYAKGVFSSINGLDKTANHYVFPHTRKAWLEGFDERGSIKDKVK
jgi:ribosome modulation factor